MEVHDDYVFDYEKEPSRDILCIDCKSFYASVEAVDRGLDPLKAKLVVMSYPPDGPRKRASGLILASSPAAKRAYGISNVSRAGDLPYPYPADLYIVPPRMRYYMKKNQEINQIYQSFVAAEDHAVYSIDESFMDITSSMRLFKQKTAEDFAAMVQRAVFEQTGIYVTVGIGDNPLLAKLALDNAAKHRATMRAEWRYADVPQTLWQIDCLTDFWGIGKRMARHLQALGIQTIRDLAHSNPYLLRDKFGRLGEQLYAHSWGIDRSFIEPLQAPASKSLGNHQILPRDYDQASEILTVVKEMGEQVATRLRREGYKAQGLTLVLAYSKAYSAPDGRTFRRASGRLLASQRRGEILDVLQALFDQIYEVQLVRSLGVTAFDLVEVECEQLSLFSAAPETDALEAVIDKIRQKYGFKSLVPATSLCSGACAIARSQLVGGHAGGLAGIEDVAADG
ncbi:Y-family DNA polymerase [Aerococcus sp. HMSC06H08]|nr:Y-family DNA polymerase [Aerococcus sp. HMSC06H08]OFT41499.1 excinuclease ABC subunit A [Aerococcus sp. HMSC06H08]